MVADIIAHVLEAAQRGEVGNGVGKSDFSAKRHARGQASHILFCHSGVDELLWELFHEGSNDTKSQIANNQNNALVLLGQLEQFFDKCGSHLQLSNSARALVMSSPKGAR